MDLRPSPSHPPLMLRYRDTHALHVLPLQMANLHFLLKFNFLKGVGYSLLLSQAGGPFCVSSEPDMLTASLRCTRGFSWLSVLDCSVKDPTSARPGSLSLPCLSSPRLGGARLVLYGGLLHKELMLTRMFEERLTLVEQRSSTCEL